MNCKCGCGKRIVIKPHHKYMGVPKYLHGHNYPLEKYQFKKGHKTIGYWIGKKRSEETKRKMSEAHKKIIDFHRRQKTMLGKHHSEESKKRISEALKGKPQPWMQGENHPMWKGGAVRMRKGHEWQIIRKEVLIKYDYKCLHCEKEESLHIHHKIPYRQKKEHKIENLIPLCNSCHTKEEWKVQHLKGGVSRG